MQAQEIDFIRDCLPQNRTLFYYYKDRYAGLLLKYAVADGASVATVKKSRWSALLNRPVVRNRIANCGDGKLYPSAMDSDWPTDTHPFRLTLSRWPSAAAHRVQAWQQTSRRQHNLVLHVNFAGLHNDTYARIFGRENNQAFAIASHPVDEREITLSWARLDLDWENGEALIEEIQSDWLRYAAYRLQAGGDRFVVDHLGQVVPARWRRRQVRRSVSRDELHRYVQDTLQPYRRMWAELTLAAGIWFLVEEIGIRRIFYHTFESSLVYKHMHAAPPPRSLYTDLPTRFCFQVQDVKPEMLKEHRGIRRQLKRTRMQTARFHLLDLNAPAIKN
ncbi:MAG: hypothetical protein KDK30_00365 [Leptospiraceae bacterium]|nr:hypothetical protein [Leptospiraceae bacterium]